MTLPKGENVSVDTTPTSLPQWVAPSRVADHLGVSEKTVRRLIASGDLEARRMGKRLIRVSRDSLLALGQPVGGGSW